MPSRAGTEGSRNLTPVCPVPCSSPDIWGHPSRSWHSRVAGEPCGPQPHCIRGPSSSCCPCLSGAGAAALGGGQQAGSPQELGTPPPSSTSPQWHSSRGEGAPSIRGAAWCHGDPWESLSTAIPLAVPPSPSPSRACSIPGEAGGVPAAPLAPRAPRADLAPPACGSTAASSAPSFASGAGGAPPSHPSCFRLPGCPCPSVCLSISPSVHPPELSTLTGWLPLPGVNRAGIPDPPALGVPCHHGPVPSPAAASGKGGYRGRPPLPGTSSLLGAPWALHKGWCVPAVALLSCSPRAVVWAASAPAQGGAGALLPPRTHRTVGQMGERRGQGDGARTRGWRSGTTTAASTRGGAGEPYPGMEPSPGTEPRGGEARAPLTSA